MKYIIKNHSKYSDKSVLEYVANVVGMGLISETGRGKQHCFVTSYEYGPTIHCVKNASGSETFSVFDDKEVKLT